MFLSCWSSVQKLNKWGHIKTHWLPYTVKQDTEFSFLSVSECHLAWCDDKQTSHNALFCSHNRRETLIVNQVSSVPFSCTRWHHHQLKRRERAGGSAVKVQISQCKNTSKRTFNHECYVSNLNRPFCVHGRSLRPPAPVQVWCGRSYSAHPWFWKSHSFFIYNVNVKQSGPLILNKDGCHINTSSG